MKWRNKGEELKNKAENILNEFKKRKEVYIFGAGILGEELRSVLENYGIFAGYIDNDKQKQKNSYNEAQVISIQDYIVAGKHKWIVVAASDQNTKNICRQLVREKLIPNVDFFILQHFMNETFPIISYYFYDKLYVDLAQISLTERCTLKCKKCAHACYNVSNESKDLELDFVKESADNFFSKFDIVKEFVLIGGEPFLYKDINAVIKYIGEKYRDKMIIFSITTNGTILPDDETVKLCTRYNITLRVSDYSCSIPRLKSNYDKLYEKFAGNRIVTWKTDNENSWFDYGFGEFDRGDETDGLIMAFDKCKTPCREIRGSKYYYCVMARSVAENLKMGIGEKDYIDLKQIENREMLLEFQMGFSDKGYLDMCRFCRGADAKDYLIPAAEQKGGRL